MRLRMWNKIRRIFNCLCYVGVALIVLNVIGIPTLIEQLMADPTTLSLFTHDVKKFCGGNFKGYVHKFAVLKNVVVVPGRAEGQPGGEEISSVLNQPEYLEYFDFTPGFFTIPCRSIPLYRFRDDHHLNLWMDVLEPESKDVSSDIVRAKGENQVHRRFTIAVTRYEYANLYHQIADFYNAYIMLRVFGLDPDETDILFVDGHPKSALDDIWDTLFGTVIRVGRLDGLTLFENLIWSIQGYTSSLHQHDREKIPEIPEFADFVLKRHDAAFTRKPDCMNVSVLFVWRRNYVAHPRNPSGVVARKILNEAELLSYVKKSLTINGKPSGTVKGVHLESLSFAEQLRLARNTDILVGMHGAGLSHTLFLPPHAGLVEIFSKSTLAVNRHFKAMAAWRGLHYRKYQVSFSSVGNENDDTVLEPEEIAEIIDEIKTEICQAL